MATFGSNYLSISATRLCSHVHVYSICRCKSPVNMVMHIHVLHVARNLGRLVLQGGTAVYIYTCMLYPGTVCLPFNVRFCPQIKVKVPASVTNVSLYFPDITYVSPRSRLHDRCMYSKCKLLFSVGYGLRTPWMREWAIRRMTGGIVRPPTWKGIDVHNTAIKILHSYYRGNGG